MIIVKGGVTAPKGFLASAVAAGIKKSGRKDLALLYSEVPAVAAAAFTTNRFQASPIKVSLVHIRNKTHQAIVVNSGNANCANGRSGDRNALLMTEYAAKAMGLGRKEVLVASTGIIGKDLPLEKIKTNLAALASGLSARGGGLFAEAIRTTDTKKKEYCVKERIGPDTITIAGACKGVGMIYPNLKTARHATMLSFLTTDASISKGMLEKALDESLQGSFNMVSVDGDMSTNDACFIMANGLAGNKRIDKKGGSYARFAGALKFLTCELAKMIVRDGEGATKFVEIEVLGAATGRDAVRAARAISRSNLLKCCIYGEDPNWGRIIAACGASGVNFDPGRVDVYLGPIKAFSGGGRMRNFDKTKAKRLFEKDDISIRIDLRAGRGKARAWTCDFSKEYVEINSEYST